MGAMEQNKKRRILLGEDGNALMGIIGINAVLFVLLNFIMIIYFLGKIDMEHFNKEILSWFVVPGSLAKLASRPWVLLTYMFSHLTVWHMIGNMLCLWAFGYILQDLTGNRHLAPLYLYGGFFGSVFFLLMVNTFPVFHGELANLSLIGCGASIMAIAVATTTVAPDYRVFPMIMGGIPLWVLTLIFACLDFGLMSGYGGGIGVAHLAGGLIGFVYIKRMHTGKDWGLWMHRFYNWIFNLFEPQKQTLKNQLKQEVFYESKGQAFKKTSNITQQKIDEILDKINRDGYHFLNDEEKEYLKRASKDL